MTEAEFTSALTAALARRDLLARPETPRGWWLGHDEDSRRQRQGEPDLLAVWLGPGPCPGPHPMFFAELKARGRRTDLQRRIGNALSRAGVPYEEWQVDSDSDVAEAAFGLPAGALTTTTSPIGDTRQPEPEAMPDLSDLPPAMQARARQALAEEAARRREHRAKVEAKQR